MITIYEDRCQQKERVEDSRLLEKRLEIIESKGGHDNSHDSDMWLVQLLERQQAIRTLQDHDPVESSKRLKVVLLADKVAGFEQLVVRYGDLFHQVAWNVLYNYHVAQDAVSESYVKIHVWLEKVERGELMKIDLLPYFCKVVRNTSLTLLEKEKKQRLRVKEQKKVLLGKQRCAETRDEALVREETYSILREELGQLSEKYNRALRLHYFLDEEILEGLSDIESERYAQLEKYTGTKAATLRSHVSRGGQLLKKRLVTRGITSCY